MQEPLKLEKARKQVFPWSLQKEGRLVCTLRLTQRNGLRALDLQNNTFMLFKVT